MSTMSLSPSAPAIPAVPMTPSGCPVTAAAALLDEADEPDEPGERNESDGLDERDLPKAARGASAPPPAPPPPPRPPKLLFMQEVLEQIRPLEGMTREEFEAFLYSSRMYPSLSRFEPACVEYFVPRSDITVGLAMKTLRERIEHAAVVAELVYRLKRDDDEDGALCNDDEAVIASAAIRDDLREALGMLGVYEQAIRDGVAVVQYHQRVPAEVA
ncbi:hypothetical protein [Mitsuaria sp. BK037]|uniref:hypothetical protein n=1 Tax=Mitsuaria sp. BK037 TaxID=2587122 RepID=UPI00161401B4|nr:hypothetical protein [Mitsuaria sp. BK037]MBB3281875.1 hypothetical protein [Mitsuaria sp. BK037]